MNPVRISDHILYRDHQIIVAFKPAGIPSQPDSTNDISFLQLLQQYANLQLYLITRLDRPASGLMLLAKNKNAANLLTKQLQDKTLSKIYLAVTEKAPPQLQGELIQPLQELTKQNKSIILEQATASSQEARLNYSQIGASEKYFLLIIHLITGRHHQIRAQLANMGCPIKGDIKYGARRGNKDRSIHLHSWKLSFDHPISGTRMSFNAPPPDDSLWNFFKGVLDA